MTIKNILKTSIDNQNFGELTSQLNGLRPNEIELLNTEDFADGYSLLGYCLYKRCPIFILNLVVQNLPLQLQIFASIYSTPCELALACGDLGALEFLLSQDITCTVSPSRKSLLIAYLQTQDLAFNPDILAKLIKQSKVNQLFIDYSAYCNSVTALHLAVEKNNPAAVAQLIKAGADLSLSAGQRQLTAYQLALNLKFQSIVALLEQAPSYSPKLFKSLTIEANISSAMTCPNLNNK